MHCLLSDASLQRDAQQLLRFDRELHWQLAEDFPAEPADDQVDRVLGREAALATVKDLILSDLRRRRFVLYFGGRVFDLEVRKGVGPALVADEQRVALRVVARAPRLFGDLDQPAIRVLPVS